MLYVALFAASLLLFCPAATSGQSDSSCRACNCQFNNIEVLDRLIESKINRSLANDPGKQQLCIMPLAMYIRYLFVQTS